VRWIETSRELVLTSHLFRFFRVGFRSEASGKAGTFDVLETKNWMNVVPVLEDGAVLLVEQFRYGTGAGSLEFPAGQVEPGEDPLATAQRELREETGAVAERIVPVGRCHPNPAIMGNSCYHYVATGVRVTGAQALDEFEELRVKRVPLAAIDSLIAKGEITHALTITTWYYAKESGQLPKF
jgi:8-oxo-dGTP pyrophosphatase MutT (NUDIX family)